MSFSSGANTTFCFLFTQENKIKCHVNDIDNRLVHWRHGRLLYVLSSVSWQVCAVIVWPSRGLPDEKCNSIFPPAPIYLLSSLYMKKTFLSFFSMCFDEERNLSKVLECWLKQRSSVLTIKIYTLGVALNDEKYGIY